MARLFYPDVGTGPHSFFTSHPTAESSLQGRSCPTTPAIVQPLLGQSAAADGRYRIDFEPAGGKRLLFCMSFMYQKLSTFLRFPGALTVVFSHEVDTIRALTRIDAKDPCSDVEDHTPANVEKCGETSLPPGHACTHTYHTIQIQIQPEYFQIEEYKTVQYNTMQYTTIPYNTIQYMQYIQYMYTPLHL